MHDEAKTLSEPSQSNQTAHNGFWKKIFGVSMFQTKLSIVCGVLAVKRCLRKICFIEKWLAMLYGNVRLQKRFGGSLNYAKVISSVVLLASEIYSLGFFNSKNQIWPRFLLMLLGVYGRRGMHYVWGIVPFLMQMKYYRNIKQHRLLRILLERLLVLYRRGSNYLQQWRTLNLWPTREWLLSRSKSGCIKLCSKGTLWLS